MSKMRRIAVMTSGGDSQGMNGAVRAVVRTAIAMGCEAYAVKEGYRGLVKGQIEPMAWGDVRGWLSEGGTLIGTARCKEFMERPGRLQAARNLVAKGIFAIVIVGGDGSLTGADLFRKEWPSLIDELARNGSISAAQAEGVAHLNVVGLVGSIDNDMSLTDATIGCYSSLNQICRSIDDIFSTASSHQRAFVIEVMGRHCGWLALMAGISTGADYIFIPERPPEADWVQEMSGIIRSHRKSGKRITIVIVAEGAHDIALEKITPERVRDILSNDLHLDTRITTLGHVQRGGLACAYDRTLSTLQGVEAVKACLEATPDTPSPMIAIDENKIVRKPLVDAVAATKAVAAAIKAKDFQKAMSLRDSEFTEHYDAYMVTRHTEQPGMLLPEDKRLRIAIIHVGAPAGGVNSATRAAVAYCLARGHHPIAIHNGFSGLCRHHDDKPLGSVREFDWVEVDGWINKGGSELGMNRAMPNEDIKTTAACFEKYRFQALFLVGGFEAFAALQQMRTARGAHAAFRIPMALLPATISNNVPGTEYSLGSDTCLNALVKYCDDLRQSADGSRRRVFVVETQGGKSGYIATMAGLCVGALFVYTPEEGLDLATLHRDIAYLRASFARDRGEGRAGKLILRNEHASATYTTRMIHDIITDEARGRFESRFAVPGHVQQGGQPSPMDRVRATRLAVRCIQHLEAGAAGGGGAGEEGGPEQTATAAVIGIRGAKVVLGEMEGLEAETDWRDRRPLREHWVGLKDIVDSLSGRPQWKDCCGECGRETPKEAPKGRT